MQPDLSRKIKQVRLGCEMASDTTPQITRFAYIEDRAEPRYGAFQYSEQFLAVVIPFEDSTEMSDL